MTRKQRIASVEVLKGSSMEEVKDLTGYHDKSITAVGKAIMSNTQDNPFLLATQRKNEQMTKVIKFWSKIIDTELDLDKLKPSDIIKASELMARYLGLLSKDGDNSNTRDTYNTLVVSDVREMSEDDVLRLLARLRKKDTAPPGEGIVNSDAQEKA